eukprot:gb/GECG01011512.1/.p1 GENE.gb/GECG01011512.1/~~gb/GECG01011512.1/.p1  ORF type:complete len:656 (+),score=55.79 gb/GECG01011512.1/:1-1968(+)
MPFKDTILRNHYTLFCIIQSGLHGSHRVEVRSRKGLVLEAVAIPFYKSKGCGLLSANFKRESQSTMCFAGCDKNGKKMKMVEPKCTKQKRFATPVACLRGGFNSINRIQGVIVLPRETAAIISNADLKLNQRGNVLFTTSSLLLGHNQEQNSSTQPLLTFRRCFSHGGKAWFAFGSGSNASSLIKFEKSNVALNSSIFIGSGYSGAILETTSSLLQISMSEFSSTGGMSHMKLINSYAVIYRTHSICSCSASRMKMALSNFEFVGQLMQSLPPTIWMSTIVNRCQSAIVSLRSLNRVHLRESIVEKTEILPQDNKLMLFDVLGMAPEIAAALQRVKEEKQEKHQVDNTTDILHFYSHSRFYPHDRTVISIKALVETYCGFPIISKGSLGWLGRFACNTDRSMAKVLEFDDCPVPPENSQFEHGTQHEAYKTTVDGLNVVIRYPRRGNPPPRAYIETFVHPSIGFLMDTCRRPDGKTGEVYPAAFGTKPKDAKRDLSLDSTFNIAMDMIEAFAFLHYGNPFGSAPHGDFAVGPFQGADLPPRIKNVVVSYPLNGAKLFDFDTAELKYQTWRFLPMMRQDLSGVGFVLWNLCGVHVGRKQMQPDVNSQLVTRCSPSLQGLCAAAHIALSMERPSDLTTEKLYMMVQDAVPRKLKDEV